MASHAINIDVFRRTSHADTALKLTDFEQTSNRKLFKIKKTIYNIYILTSVRNLNLFCELAALVQFNHDVGPADELARDIQLRDGGPGGVYLDTAADTLIIEHIHSLIRCVEGIQNATGRIRKPTERMRMKI